jgi:hypothetical protein
MPDRVVRSVQLTIPYSSRTRPALVAGFVFNVGDG